MPSVRAAIPLAVVAIACGLFEPHRSNRLEWLWRTTFANAPAMWSGVPNADGSNVFVELPGRLVAAMSASDGVERWRSSQLGSGTNPSTTNLVLSGTHLLVAEVSVTTALDVSTGATEWTYTPASSGVSVWQSADAGRYYLGEVDHRVTALNVATGAVLWSVDFAPAATFRVYTSATAVSGDTVYVTAKECQNAACGPTRGLIVALSAGTGRELWRYETPETSTDAYAFLVSGPYLIVNDYLGGSLFAVNRFTKERMWRVRGEPGWIGPTAPAAVSNDTAFFGMQDQNVYAVNVRTGQVLWRSRVSGGVDGVTLCGNALFALHLGITKIDRSTGRIVGSRGTSDDPEWPTTSGGAVSSDRIIVVGRNAVYAYRGAL